MRGYAAAILGAVLAGCTAASSTGPSGIPSASPLAPPTLAASVAPSLALSPASAVPSSSPESEGPSTAPPVPSGPSAAPPVPSGPSVAPVTADIGATMPPIVHGAPLAAGPMPDAATCEASIRAERVAAQRIRAGVTLNGGRLASDGPTVAMVAEDPRASISPELGIPLTATEERLVQAEGPGEAAPLYWWVDIGAPERFGGYWMDPPGGRPAVAIAPGDPATMALARCLERPSVPVHYVQAAVTMATLEAVRSRIEADRDWLATQGMAFESLGRREDIGRIRVGVERPTAEVEAFYRQRYGWVVLVEEAPPMESW